MKKAIIPAPLRQSKKLYNKYKTAKKCGVKELLKLNIKSKDDLMRAKRKIAKKFGIKILRNSEILKAYKEMVAEGEIPESRLQERILRKRAIRTLSGVAPVAVLTKPYPCPGQCAYCPSEANVPKSYLSNEPAVMRAIRCHYHPYEQVQQRLRALEANGHEPTKIELIVIGGTWSVLPDKYKYWFITNCFKAANDYGGVKSCTFVFSKLKAENIDKVSERFKTTPNPSLLKEGRQIDQNKNVLASSPPQLRRGQGWWCSDQAACHLSISTKVNLKELKQLLIKEQRKNEKAKYKIVGLTLETRPDYLNEKELWQMRELGCTRVEIGVQIIDDKILKLNKRGHGVAEVVEATKLLKNFAFKVTYHLMQGLPGSNPKKDFKLFKQLFIDECFQPDQIKFYPTVVTKGSLLYKWWQQGKYKPYSDKILRKLVADCKRVVPSYVRIIRLIRDIPKESIVAGNIITNLRQIVQDYGVDCQCIRCREAKEKQLTTDNLRLTTIKYKASGGDEYFIQFTNKDGKVLYGFCRLRLPRDTKCPIGHLVSMQNAALIRELHVYGELVSIGAKSKVQHKGLGKRLIKQAETIAQQNGFTKVALISGVGACDYYRKLGYRLKNTYMVKNLT